MITKTHGQIHFSDLDPKRFEMLAMQIIYRMRRWEKLEHYGAAGSDDGIDIRAVELLENGKRNVHDFQCKRYDKLTKAQLENIVKQYAKDNPDHADYYYVVCGCNPSKKALEGFDKICEQFGINNRAVWSASYLEMLLYSDYHDILFAFFGVNLSIKRNNTINAIRRNVALKKKMYKDFNKSELSEDDKYAIRLNHDYSKRFKASTVLIRSIYDKHYPVNHETIPGFFEAVIYDWYHNGLEVHAHPYRVNAKIKWFIKGNNPTLNDPNNFEINECLLEVFGCIPFENIIEYDVNGDEYYSFPHLFCDYQCGTEPFEEIRYRNENGLLISNDDIIEIV